MEIDWNLWTSLNIYIYIYTRFAYAPYGACAVEQSKAWSSAATPNVKREGSQNGAGSKVLSELCFWVQVAQKCCPSCAFECMWSQKVLPELCFWVQVAQKCCPSCAFERGWPRSAETTCFCRFCDPGIAEIGLLSSERYANLIINIYTSLNVDENQRHSTKHTWTSMKRYAKHGETRWIMMNINGKYMKIDEHLEKSCRINENRWKAMNIREQSMEIDKMQPKIAETSMTNCENQQIIKFKELRRKTHGKLWCRGTAMTINATSLKIEGIQWVICEN